MAHLITELCTSRTLSSWARTRSRVVLFVYTSTWAIPTCPSRGRPSWAGGLKPQKNFPFFFFFFCVIWPSHHIHKAGSGHCAPARRHSELCFLYQLNIVFNYNRMCFEYYITWNMLAYHGCPEWSCKNYKSKRCFYWVARDLGCGVK
jgi:hypothetical protein